VTGNTQRKPHLGGVSSKGKLGVSRLFDLDHERHSSFGAPKWERLACVLVRDGIHVLEIAIRMSFLPVRIRGLAGLGIYRIKPTTSTTSCRLFPTITDDAEPFP